MRVLVLSLVLLASVSLLASASEDDNTFMQFAYIRDATVDFDSIFDMAEAPQCEGLTAMEAAFDERCHFEAKSICEAMENCGGFVIEPIDIEDADEPGITVKVYTKGAMLLSMPGAVIFEYRGQVGGVAEEDTVDEFINENINHEQLAVDIEAALVGDKSITSIEMAIDAFVAAMDSSDEKDAEELLKEEEDINELIAELSEKKRAAIQKVADKTMEKAYKAKPIVNLYSSRGLPHLVPKVTCTRGKVVAPGRNIPAQIRPGRKAVYEFGECTQKRLVSGITCSCTDAEYIPKSCTPASFTPGSKGSYTPATFTPLRYTKGTCSVSVVNKFAYSNHLSP